MGESESSVFSIKLFLVQQKRTEIVVSKRHEKKKKKPLLDD